MGDAGDQDDLRLQQLVDGGNGLSKVGASPRRGLKPQDQGDVLNHGRDQRGAGGRGIELDHGDEPSGGVVNSHNEQVSRKIP